MADKNKFWGGGNSSSESESDSSSSSDEAPKAAAAAPRKVMARWAEESSSDDEVETKRVVRSQRDKRYVILAEKIKIMRTHTKNNDYSQLTADYEGLLKMLEKFKTLIEQDGGPPNTFIKAIGQLEQYTDDQHKDHMEKKANKGERLSESKAKAFNSLRAKVRKGNRAFEDALKQYQDHPSDFESAPEDEEDKSDSDSDSDEDAGAESGSSSSSSGSSSGSSSSSDSSGSDSDSDSDSSSASDSFKSGDDSDEGGTNDEDTIREKTMLKWLVTPAVAAKRKRKEELALDSQHKQPRADAKPREGKAKKNEKEDKGAKAVQDPDEYTSESLVKKVTEIAQSRGRRGFERKTYVEKLSALLPHASKISPRHQLHVYGSMVSADFDNTGSAFAAMRLDLWNEALVKVGKMMPLLEESFNELREQGLSNKEILETSGDSDEDPTVHSRMQELFISVAEKLDDELYKALQFTVDVYGAEYQEILANSTKFLVLLKRMLDFFERTEQVIPLGTVALRFMEQIYYKPDCLNAAVYEAIHHMVPEEEKSLWVWPKESSPFMSQLCRYVHAKGDTRGQHRALLLQAYHLALSDRFQEARDLLHLTKIEEKAKESDINVQILYNRVIAQMGLCAFRLGKIHESHSCLMDLCMHGKSRELLAQGLSFAKAQERSPDQERAERLRQMPWHMYINLEVLDSSHHISAMLLEVPNLAMQAIDPTNRRGIISKVLRRALEQFDKQVYNGPPENPKEAVVSCAKALQRGDWQSAWAVVEDLKLWSHIDVGNPENGENVKAMIKEKMKTEALRTYLFAHASIYDAFQLEMLANMFELPSSTVHSVVSKMMIRDEITAFWDESSKFLLMQHTEPTPLQRLALTLADKDAAAVEMNERLVDGKTGGYGFKAGDGKGGGKWGDRGGEGKGKGYKGYGGMDDRKGRGKKGGQRKGNPRAGWENARAGAFGGGAPQQRGWGDRRPEDRDRRPGGDRDRRDDNRGGGGDRRGPRD